MNVELVLTVMGLALGVGAFLASILPPDSRQRLRIILITTFVAFILVSSILIFYNRQRETAISAIADRILLELRTRRTADELVESIDPNRSALVYEALDRLRTSLQIRSDLANIEDEKKLPHKARLYYLP
jgi:hypothetical protein